MNAGSRPTAVAWSGSPAQLSIGQRSSSQKACVASEAETFVGEATWLQASPLPAGRWYGRFGLIFAGLGGGTDRRFCCDSEATDGLCNSNGCSNSGGGG